MRQRLEHGRRRRRRLGSRRAEQTSLQRGRRADRRRVGIEVDRREHCVHEHAEAHPVRPIARRRRARAHDLDGRRRDRDRRIDVHAVGGRPRGRGFDAHARRARVRPQLSARGAPLRVRLDAAFGRGAAFVGFEQLLLAKADGLLDFEGQDRGIPPHDLMLADLGNVQTGRDRTVASG